MTTLYEFVGGFKKAGKGTAPSSAPTITVVDSANNILVAAGTATTALTNLVGGYRYSYSGADGLTCYAKFTTTDMTMDEYELFCIPNINPVVRDVQTRLPAALTANGNMKSSLLEIIANPLSETSAGYLAAAFKKFFDKASPTGTINSLPDAVAGANNGLPTTDGTIVNQTVNVGKWLNVVPAALTATGKFIQVALLRWLSDDAAGTPLALTSASLVQADAIKEAGATPNNLAAGAAMDIVSAPNATGLAAIATALLDLANGVETSHTLRQVLRVIFGVMAGKSNGGNTTTQHFRNQADTKDRVTATTDVDGNRSSVTLDES